MFHSAGESVARPFQLRFDRRLKLEFHGSNITSDTELLVHRELDEALGLMSFIKEAGRRIGKFPE